MSKCHVINELSAYLDDQLSADKLGEVEKHLRECEICRNELEQLKAVSQKLKTWQPPMLGPEFDIELRNKIVSAELQEGRVKMKKKTLAILIPSSVLAGILVIAFFGLSPFVHRGLSGKSRAGVEFFNSFPASGVYRNSDDIGGQYAKKDNELRRGWNKQYAVNEALPRDEAYYGIEKSSRGSLGMAGQYGPDHGSIVQADKYKVMSDSRVAQAVSPGVPASPDTTGYQGSIIVVQPVLPATGEGEKIIRTAEVRLEVADGRDTYKKAGSICQEFGGYLAASNFYKDEEGREAGTVTMRIPKDKFLAALDKLNTLGKVENISTGSQDVSQEYANLKTQLDTTMIVYNKMLEALQKRQVTIPDAVRLESELTPVRQRIENLKNQLEALNNSVSFTTINLYFHEPRVSAKVFAESKRYVKESMLSAAIGGVKFIAGALPAAIVLVIVLAILFAAALVLKHWIILLFKKE